MLTTSIQTCCNVGLGLIDITILGIVRKVLPKFLRLSRLLFQTQTSALKQGITRYRKKNKYKYKNY